jgi:hypothetical protein
MMAVGISLIVIGVVGQLYSRTPLPLKSLVWTLVIALTVVWVVSH